MPGRLSVSKNRCSVIQATICVTCNCVSVGENKASATQTCSSVCHGIRKSLSRNNFLLSRKAKIVSRNKKIVSRKWVLRVTEEQKLVTEKLFYVTEEVRSCHGRGTSCHGKDFWGWKGDHKKKFIYLDTVNSKYP